MKEYSIHPRGLELEPQTGYFGHTFWVGFTFGLKIQLTYSKSHRLDCQMISVNDG